MQLANARTRANFKEGNQSTCIFGVQLKFVCTSHRRRRALHFLLFAHDWRRFNSGRRFRVGLDAPAIERFNGESTCDFALEISILSGLRKLNFFFVINP